MIKVNNFQNAVQNHYLSFGFSSPMIFLGSKFCGVLPYFIYKPFCSPFAGVPAAKENDATDIFVEGETYPHTYKSVAQGDADDVTKTHGNAPLEDNADGEGVDGVTCGPERAASENIRDASDLQEAIDDEHPYTHGNDFLIIGKDTEKVSASKG
jgi:hypothetical protein